MVMIDKTQQSRLLSAPEVLAAQAYAKMAHESIGQRRKNTNLPYISHPAAVAKIVAGTQMASKPDGVEMVAASWLHDVIEDVVRHVTRPEHEREAMMRDMRSRFSPKIITFVLEVTNTATKADGNRAARCQKNLDHILLASPYGATIKYADIKHNSHDIAEHDVPFAMTYLPEKADVLIQVRHGDHALRQETIRVILKGIETILPFAGPKHIDRLSQSHRSLLTCLEQ